MSLSLGIFPRKKATRRKTKCLAPDAGIILKKRG